jgi:hypothetical protein
MAESFNLSVALLEIQMLKQENYRLKLSVESKCHCSEERQRRQRAEQENLILRKELEEIKMMETCLLGKQLKKLKFYS